MIHKTINLFQILCAMISLGVMMSVVAAGLAMGGSDKKREAPQGSYSFDS